MSQAIKNAVIYTRVSTGDQDCGRQLADLRAYAERAGYTVVGEYTEKASGAKNDRAERAKVIQLARQKKIDVVLVTELTRWGRSTPDLLTTVKQLESWNVALKCQTGIDFDLSTPQGKLMLTLMAGLAEFERDLTAERTRSGLANAKARGIKLGRGDAGQHHIDKKHGAAIAKFIEEGRTVRWISDELHISPTTVQAIKKRQLVKA